ncbi:hypothetical protein MY4038_006312 [Beauveria bassiana]
MQSHHGTPEDGSAPGQTVDDFTRALNQQAMPNLVEYEENPALLESRRVIHSPPEQESPPQFSKRILGILQHADALKAVMHTEKELYQQHEAILQRVIKFEDVQEFESRSEERPKRTPNRNKECLLAGRPAARLGPEAGLEMERIKVFHQEDDRCSDNTRQQLEVMSPQDKKMLASIGVLMLVREAIKDCGAMSPGQYGKLKYETALQQSQIPEEGWTCEQGDNFIGSRPWFAFQVECMVESTRRGKVTIDDQQRWPTAADDFIRRQWMEKGIWDDKWDDLGRVLNESMVGWRWKGEGDEPEGADLEELNSMDEIVSTLRHAEGRRLDHGPRRSARIAKQRVAQATEDSQLMPQVPTRRRRVPSGAAPTRIQPARQWKGKRRPYLAEDNDGPEKSEGQAKRRRRRG